MPIMQTVIQGGGTQPTEKYPLLSRVKDDSNNEIGTVVGFHYDANNTEYAVVCLDAQFRLASGDLLSAGGVDVYGLPQYQNLSLYGAKETATFNCDKIMVSVLDYGGQAVTHCRSKTFTVDNVQYAGQLPTLMELLKILEFMTEINAADPTASSYPSLVLSNSTTYWSSSCYCGGVGWTPGNNGEVRYADYVSQYFVAPILELPNAA